MLYVIAHSDHGYQTPERTLKISYDFTFQVMLSYTKFV